MNNNQKMLAIVLGAIVFALVLVTLVAAAGLWIGSNVLRTRVDTGSPGGIIADSTGSDWNWDGMPFNRGYGNPGTMGPGMMGRTWDREDMPFGSPEDMPCGSTPGLPCDQGYLNPGSQSSLSLEEAKAAVEDYVQRLGYTGLHVTEVMEFEQNFYAIVAEEETGIGAMELLVNKSDGSVGPEPGPNMMWNAEYGMHRGGRMGMMGGYATDEMTISPGDAEQIAQRWLDANLPGRTAGEADPFYGYYTLHFLNDGQIEGMLSVHGSSGDVWYHSWHGAFIDMVGDHE